MNIVGYTFQIGLFPIYESNYVRMVYVGYTLQIGIISNSIFKGTYRVTISTNSYLSFSIETNLSLCSVLSLGSSNRPVLKCQ